MDIGLSESGDYAIAAPISRPYVYKKHLVFSMIYNCIEIRPATHEIGGRQLTFEY